MDIRRDPDLGRQAVLWVATVFVVLIGAAACTFIILVTVEHPSRHLIVLGAVFASIVLLLIRMAMSRDTKGGNRWMLNWLIGQKPDSRQVLRIGRKRRKEARDYGKNGPPTLDSVREAAEQSMTWVPHGPPPDRSRPKSS